MLFCAGKSIQQIARSVVGFILSMVVFAENITACGLIIVYKCFILNIISLTFPLA